MVWYYKRNTPIVIEVLLIPCIHQFISQCRSIAFQHCKTIFTLITLKKIHFENKLEDLVPAKERDCKIKRLESSHFGVGYMLPQLRSQCYYKMVVSFLNYHHAIKWFWGCQTGYLTNLLMICETFSKIAWKVTSVALLSSIMLNRC